MKKFNIYTADGVELDFIATIKENNINNVIQYIKEDKFYKIFNDLYIEDEEEKIIKKI